MPHTPNFNPNFSTADNRRLAALIKHEPAVDYIPNIRKRSSSLDPHLPEILEKRSEGWSYNRIALYLKKYPKFTSLNKTTVMRRINHFFTEE